MILATKNGWLIAVDLIAETKKEWLLQPHDQKVPMRIDKSDVDRRVFASMDVAIKWIEEVL